MRSSEIVKKFNNKIIVIDEAPNLRLSDVKVNYEQNRCLWRSSSNSYIC